MDQSLTMDQSSPEFRELMKWILKEVKEISELQKTAKYRISITFPISEKEHESKSDRTKNDRKDRC